LLSRADRDSAEQQTTITLLGDGRCGEHKAGRRTGPISQARETQAIEWTGHFLGSVLLLALLLVLHVCAENAKLDSSLKRHTALIKRIKVSMALDNRDHILKDIESLTLEKYIDEIAGAIVEGLARCKAEKDVWAAVEV